MRSSLDMIIWISLGIVVVCTLIIIAKFIIYFDNKRKMMNCKKSNMQDIRILEVKLDEIKLKNKGHSIDENIKIIYNDTDIGFSMEWGDMIG